MDTEKTKMKPILPLLTALLLQGILSAADIWDTRRITADFHAEGAGIGDINGDGVNDIAYGPFWFAGPEFEHKRRFAAGEKFPIYGYSDNFFSFVRDLTGDGRHDIVVFGFPGKEVRLFVNPGAAGHDAVWPVHVIAKQLCHEATSLVDLIPGGLPEIVGARDKAYGYYTATADVTKPWAWHGISATGRAEMPFGHGLGVGDVNGDGRLDVIEKAFWFEQPEKADAAWKEHRWAVLPYGSGGAQILVDDVDGDKDSDLITSLNAHGTGIAWFEQTQPGKFARHDILGATSTENPHGVTFREIHGMTLADVDGDGMQDFVTGKRFLAHNGRQDDGAYQEAVVYWFRKVKSAAGIEFVPHRVDNDSGIGVGVPVGDLNGDGKLDIVSANKRGLAVHLQTKRVLDGAAERWRVAGGRPQEHYGDGLTPQEAVKKFAVPPGFSVDLIASEPQITQPIAMCFDARGRLWVAEGVTYPVRAAEGAGKDRIHIFADENGDGSFESRKVFAEGLNLVSGIQVGFGGVFVGAAPYLLFIPDKDADDVPDSKPEVLLDGWGYQDTHETLNSFTWGPDGWLYGCQGVFTKSLVGKPGTPDLKRTPLNACVWRWHPVRREFEVFSEGASNPWGVDFDAHGDAFITACVIPHLYHVSQGGRYTRQSGQHVNPYIFDDIKTIADHLHYVGADIRANGLQVAGWRSRFSDSEFSSAKLPDDLDTSALGGGHAHSGLAIYQADEFPPAMRGDLFFSNLHGHRVVRERVERDGSGHIARHMPDFALAQDKQFIGVSVVQGPDGALYVSDWHDKQNCHHRDVEAWDRENGRIFRVRHGEAVGVKMNLAAESDAALVSTLAHRNVFQARQAQRLLQERVTFGKSEPAALKPKLAQFETQHANDIPLRLRAFWTMWSCGLLDTSDLIARLSDSSEHVRGFALQFLGEGKSALPSDALAAVEKHLNSEDSMVTRRFAASLLQRLPLEQRWDIAKALIRHPNDQHDRNIPLLTWYGIEPLVEADPARALALNVWPKLREFIARRAAMLPAGREALMTSLAEAKDSESFTQRAMPLLAALEQLPPVARPAGWEKARATGEKLAVLDAVRKLGARFGDADFFAHWRSLARDAKANDATRIQAIELLQAGADPKLGALARSLLDVKPLLPALVKALRTAPSTETAQALVARLADFPLELRNAAINLLATRPEMALVLLQAVDAKKLAPSLISPVMLDQFARFENKDISVIIERHWTRGSGAGVDLKQLASPIVSWQSKLNERVIALADASRGREVYQRTCGICHPIFGEGTALGPDLTGSNRANLAYVLENVLAPSAVVGRDYLLNIITLKDGSVVSGIVRRDTPEFLTLAMPGGSSTDVKKANIAKRDEMPTSLMPPGLFDALPLTQVADLVKYLASPAQVAVARASSLSGAAGFQPASGGQDARETSQAVNLSYKRIEAEDLRFKHAKITGGELRRQDMAGFKNDKWSAGNQLFWVSVKMGDTLTLTVPDAPTGTHDITLRPTLARDYGRFRITIAGQSREADLYHGPFVKIGPPVVFKDVRVEAGKPLTIVIEPTGANPEAKIGKYGFVFGLDCIDIGTAKPVETPKSAPQAISTPQTPPITLFAKPASGPLRIEKLATALAITTSGAEPVELARFITQAPADTPIIVPSAAYVNPLRTPRGIDVTAFAPGPHRYYRGLFMGFVDVQGTHPANYWGGGGGPIQGSVIINKSVSHIEGSTFTAQNEWQKDGHVLVQEDVTATAHLDGNATLLDLSYTFTALADDVRLANCNVGGLALPVRYDGQLTPHGPAGPVKLPSANYRKNDTNWPASPWYGYTVKLPEGHIISAAIIDHPSNPETRWHCALGARVINPNITTLAEKPLKRGAPLTLRYRVVAQDGEFDRVQMKKWADTFVMPSTP